MAYTMRTRAPTPSSPLLSDSTITDTNTTPTDDRTQNILHTHSRTILTDRLPKQIIRLPFDRNRSFGGNSALTGFSYSNFRTRLGTTRTTDHNTDRRLTRGQRLTTLGSIKHFRITQTRTGIDRARTRSRICRIRIQHYDILTPFSKRIIRHGIRHCRDITTNTPLLSIISGHALRVRLLVPSH